MFLWSGDSCKCQILHSNCPRHILQARTMMQCPWPRHRARVTLSWFYDESSIKVPFSAAVTAASVKPCVVNVLYIIFKQALWSSALDLDFAFQGFCHDFTSSLALKGVSEAVIAASVKPCIIIVLFKHTLWPYALDLDFPIEWLIMILRQV